MNHTYIYSGENNNESVPNKVEHLIISEAVQSLPYKFCRAFFQLRTVVFASSSQVESIPQEAFCNCSALQEITIPSTVTSIDDFAFNFCTSLTEFVFPDGLARIGKNSFVACNLCQVRIPGSIQEIGESAFSGCPSLRQVELLEGIKVLGSYAFASSYQMEDVRLPSTLEVIGETAFAYCQGLRTIDLPKGLKKMGRRVFDQAHGLQSITIPSGVEHLEEYAFYGCSQLKQVHLQSGLVSIGVSVFGECKLLTRISIPKTVETIADVAFESCVSLVEVTMSPNGYLQSIGEEAFVCCSNLQSILIPSSVRLVGDLAFSRCAGLVTVEIPEDSDTSFGERVFSQCPLLANISIPISVDQDQLVQDCRTIEEVYGESNAFQCIRSRYQEYPIHGVCYYAPDGGGEFSLAYALAMQLKGPNPRDYTFQLVDPFGMTPFHILMSAARKLPNLLRMLLDNYPPHILGFKNRNGFYALDYLVMNWTSEAKSMTEIALHKWMVDGMQSWGLPEWRSVMVEKVNLVLSENLEVDDRRNALHEACRLMRHYGRMEATSLVEVWLWKMKIRSMRHGSKTQAIDRETMRARCGAEFIMPAIVHCLGGPDKM